MYKAEKGIFFKGKKEQKKILIQYCVKSIGFKFEPMQMSHSNLFFFII